MRKPATLYVRTSLTIFVALFIFMVFASVVVFQHLMQPLARQAAGDMAALMVLSAQTWVELTPDARPRLEAELKNYHNISITEHIDTPNPVTVQHPFIRFLKDELEKRLEQPVQINEDTINEGRVFVDIPISGKSIHISFPYQHIGANPPMVIFLLLVGAAVLIFLTSSFLVRRLTRPLEQLSQATVQMGRRKKVPALQETGAREFVLLTRSFNQMNQRVQLLLDNRDTLLGGISHDLRTPISRVHLALELLEDSASSELIESIRNDLNEMNHLIEQTLELAINDKRALDKLEKIDLIELISTEVNKFKNEFDFIEWVKPEPECIANVSQSALQRIIQNLLENAISYGKGTPIEITLTCRSDEVEIDVSDQGPGIPSEYQNDVFQPFFRLESSRNLNTGGKGLGLAIVSQLCEIYDWDIMVTTNKKGGCTFKLIIKQL